jgi:hypothetical protein
VARRLEQTASPLRNFTLTTAERVQAMVTGLPAWARRLKHIEDLSVQILELHRDGKEYEVKKHLAELVALVDAHNLYYPMEANLPLDPETSRVMDGGEPWTPMPRPTLESLLDAVREEEPPPPSTLEWRDGTDALSVAFDTNDGESVTLRLDEHALSCTADHDEIARVPTSSIEEIVAGPFLEIITNDTKTVHLPFHLDASVIRRIVGELGGA